MSRMFLVWLALASAWIAVLAVVRGPVLAQAQPQPAAAAPTLRRFGVVQSLPHGDLQPLEEHADGERRPRSERTSRRDHSRPQPSPNPLVTFTKDQIAFVYGSKWKQRYFTKVGDDYFPLGAQWDVTHKQWRAYQVAEWHGLVDGVLSRRTTRRGRPARSATAATR